MYYSEILPLHGLYREGSRGFLQLSSAGSRLCLIIRLACPSSVGGKILVLESKLSGGPQSGRSASGAREPSDPGSLGSIFHATVDLPAVDLDSAWGRHRRARRRTMTRRSGRVRVSESPGGRG
jgi:hypothetical protein